MNFDEIVNCPKSGGDLCYKTEINKDITNYYSLSCGFWTNTLMLEGSEFYKEQVDILPEIYKDLASSSEIEFIPFFLEGVAGHENLLLKEHKEKTINKSIFIDLNNKLEICDKAEKLLCLWSRSSTAGTWTHCSKRA